MLRAVLAFGLLLDLFKAGVAFWDLLSPEDTRSDAAVFLPSPWQLAIIAVTLVAVWTWLSRVRRHAAASGFIELVPLIDLRTGRLRFTDPSQQLVAVIDHIESLLGEAGPWAGGRLLVRGAWFGAVFVATAFVSLTALGFTTVTVSASAGPAVLLVYSLLVGIVRVLVFGAVGYIERWQAAAYDFATSPVASSAASAFSSPVRRREELPLERGRWGGVVPSSTELDLEAADDAPLELDLSGRAPLGASTTAPPEPAGHAWDGFAPDPALVPSAPTQMRTHACPRCGKPMSNGRCPSCTSGLARPNPAAEAEPGVAPIVRAAGLCWLAVGQAAELAPGFVPAVDTPFATRAIVLASSSLIALAVASGLPIGVLAGRGWALFGGMALAWIGFAGGSPASAALHVASAVVLGLVVFGSAPGRLRLGIAGVLGVLVVGVAVTAAVGHSRGDAALAPWLWRLTSASKPVETLSDARTETRVQLGAGWMTVGEPTLVPPEALALPEPVPDPKAPKQAAVARPLESGIEKVIDALVERGKRPLFAAGAANPRTDVRVFARAWRLPGAGSTGLEALLRGVEKLGKIATFGPPETLVAPVDGARLLPVTTTLFGRPRQGFLGIWVAGDLAWEVLALAPTQHFPLFEQELRALATKLPASAPPAPVLRADMVQRARSRALLVMTPVGSGSAVVVAMKGTKSVAITNAHVIGSSERDVSVIYEQVAPSPVPARVLDIDPAADLALLELEDGPAPVPLRPALPLPAGTAVFVTGFPFGSDIAVRERYPSPTFNIGQITDVDLDDKLRASAVAMNAGVNPGNSGGPVFDSEGSLLGVAVAHVPGSSIGVFVPTEAVRAYFARKLPAVSLHLADWPLPPPEAAPRRTEEASTRAREAVVRVRSNGVAGEGVLFDRGDGQRFLLTGSELVTSDDGDTEEEVSITPLAGGSAQREVQTAVLRTLPESSLALLRVPELDLPRPVLLAPSSELVETTPLELLTFERNSEGLVAIDSPLKSRRGALSARQLNTDGKVSLLHVDLGVNAKPPTGPVFSADGRLAGLAVVGAPHSNLTLVEPADNIAALFVGRVRAGSVRYVYDGGDRCWVEFLVELDDPLHGVERVGVVLQPPGEGHGGTSDDADLPGEEVASAVPDPLRGVVQLGVATSCRIGALGFQFVLTSGGVARRSAARAVAIDLTLGAANSATFHPDHRRLAVATEAFARAEPEPGSGWTPVCDATTPGACEQACRKRNSKACYLAAQPAFAADPAAAVDALRIACQGGVGTACLAFDKVMKLTRDERLSLYERACDGKVGRGCALAAELRRTAFNDNSQEDRRVQLQRGCDLGDGQSCRLAGLNLDGSIPSVGASVASANLYARGCDEWDAIACRMLASYHAHGYAIPRNELRAATLYDRACSDGDGAACLALARMKGEGRGVARSALYSALLLREACLLGVNEACGELRRH